MPKCGVMVTSQSTNQYMSRAKNSYNIILKATTLFGGVQVFTLLCGVIRNKLIAVWLGADGIGVIGLLNSTIELISSITGLGLRQSSVRDISLSAAESNQKLQKTTAVVTRLVQLSALLGAVAIIIFSGVLSQLTFGDNSQQFSYILLSLAVVFNAVAGGNQAILQGAGAIKILAKSTLLGSITSLIITVPIYYYYGIKGIVPTLIIMSITTAIYAYLARYKVIKVERKITVKEAIKSGTPMLKLGIYMTIGAAVTAALNYALVSWLNQTASTTQVGYYQAGFTLITRYVGLVFVAMATEYYPRLAAISADNKKVSQQVSMQIETSLLILLPIILIFLLLQDYVISILYAPEFAVVSQYTTWAIVGVVYKAISWSLGFVLLAKGAGKLFLITEVVSDSIAFAINILLYKALGIEGLGVAYTINFIIYTAVVWILLAKMYNFSPTKQMFRVAAVVITLTTAQLLLVYIPDTPQYAVTIPLAVVSAIYTIYTLKRRVKGEETP